ncbi:DNA-binding response regulator [Vagococcus martis]|uniref:DNA-binding response regulator n=1 Tax=Vagococcus martis TaxID=1768210 RepID=A0A1V4DJL5_9ENTE|nr:response regulator transcription factor [Vagococcus martis]OPF88787.1 DNA-binding response regulator [Vagococcus martis]
MADILVVEDDPVINQVITEFLTEHGYKATSVTSGKEALNVFEQQPFDLVLLDIMIPEIDGLTVLKSIRETSNVAVIMLTALGDDITQLASFNQEISDYVVKPFSPLVLMKRIENALKYQKVIEEPLIHITPDIQIKKDSLEVLYEKSKVSFTEKEFGILLKLGENMGKVVSREQLLNHVWGYDYFSDDRILDNHIKNIRKKLPSLPLKTIKGRGFIIEVLG